MRPFTLIKQIGRRLMNTGRYATPAEARHLFAQDMGYKNFREMELYAENDIKNKVRPDLHPKLIELSKRMHADKHWSKNETDD